MAAHAETAPGARVPTGPRAERAELDKALTTLYRAAPKEAWPGVDRALAALTAWIRSVSSGGWSDEALSIYRAAAIALEEYEESLPPDLVPIAALRSRDWAAMSAEGVVYHESAAPSGPWHSSTEALPNAAQRARRRAYRNLPDSESGKQSEAVGGRKQADVEAPVSLVREDRMVLPPARPRAPKGWLPVLGFELPEEVGAEVAEVAADKGVTSAEYVAEAVRRQLEQDRLAGLDAWLEQEHGPIPEDSLARAEALWPRAE
ncbi:hypothetical protein ACIGZJ_31015 [Kitasatospora sp. NPDC052868]|uniref:hypothetical protein n=1 Tax=Kitasatospora sp. NPDC052868 TaxID=3364060 RepID=UPI0037C7C0D1